MKSYVTHLPSLAILDVSGVDAGNFLQAQLTSNIVPLAEGLSTWSAWCHANGRVITTFLVTMTAGHYYLILPADMAETVCRRLKMFVLRAKVNIDNMSNQYGCLGANLASNDAAALFNWDFSIVRAVIPDDTVRAIWITARNEIPALLPGLAANGILITDERDWQLQDVLAGIPWIHAQSSEQVLPQELDLERLGALSYDKGCYPGQEVIARLHFRGRQKRQLCRGTIETTAPLPPIGSILSGKPGTSPGLILAAARDTADRIQLLMIVDTELASGGTVMLESGECVSYAPMTATI